MALQRSWRSASWRTQYGQPEQREVLSQDQAESEPTSSNSRIYVGNIPYTAQKADIEALLRDEGYRVTNMDISIDPFTYRNPSYYFVDMLTREDAQRAITSLSGKSFLGRLLKVKPCVQKHTGHSQIRSQHLSATRWNRKSRDVPSHANNHPPMEQAGTAAYDQPHENWRVYVGGLPKPINNHVSDLDIRDLFEGFNVQAVSKVNWPHEEHGRYSKYYAFVDLETVEEAGRAVTLLDGIERWGRTINVRSTRRAGTPTQ